MPASSAIALSPTWDQPLTHFLPSGTPSPYRAPLPVASPLPESQRAAAYADCEAMTAQHSKSFYMASALLKRDTRQAVRALYAFCRTADDLVDMNGATAAEVKQWYWGLLHDHPDGHDSVAIAWADSCRRHYIPLIYADQLIDGICRDLTQQRYEDFTDLITYCYSVASTVGLMSMHIIGFHAAEASRYAIKLGVALQLTNILRDVREDWERNRIYLPQDELAQFGLTEADIARGIVTDRWRAFMHFQVQRAHRIYEEAEPGIAMLGREGQLAVAAAASFYRGILTDIEHHDYDVFNRRAHLNRWQKLKRVPALLWHHRSTPSARYH